jgi:hypothetical protein
MRPLSSPSRRTNQQQTGCIHLTSCNPSVRMYRNRSGPFRILPYRMRIDLAIIGLLSLSHGVIAQTTQSINLMPMPESVQLGSG